MGIAYNIPRIDELARRGHRARFLGSSPMKRRSWPTAGFMKSIYGNS